MKRRSKRWISLLFVLLLAVTGCGKSADTSKETEAEGYPFTDMITDKGYVLGIEWGADRNTVTGRLDELGLHYTNDKSVELDEDEVYFEWKHDDLPVGERVRVRRYLRNFSFTEEGGYDFSYIAYSLRTAEQKELFAKSVENELRDRFGKPERYDTDCPVWLLKKTIIFLDVSLQREVHIQVMDRSVKAIDFGFDAED